MKRCNVCSRTYADDSMTFCLDDGSLLSASYQEGGTQQINPPRSTDPLATEVLRTNASPQLGSFAPPQQNSYGSANFQPPPPPAFVPPQTTHGLAIASFILGLIPCTCFPSLAAIILGHIALSKIAAQPTLYKGRTLAMWGTGLGYFFTVVNIIYGIIVGINSPR